MTCAKKTVRCTIALPNGPIFRGSNDCDNPQEACPRLPGEGYEKCATVCGQRGHAEVQALRAAEGHDLRAGIAMLEGHTYMCQSCQEALVAAGVRTFRLGAP